MLSLDQLLAVLSAILWGSYSAPLGSPACAACDKVARTGWTLQMKHMINPPYPLSPGVWSSPAVSGTRPPPCAAFSLTMVDDHHAVMFGGRHHTGQRRNDVYTLDLARMVSA